MPAGLFSKMVLIFALKVKRSSPKMAKGKLQADRLPIHPDRQSPRHALRNAKKAAVIKPTVSQQPPERFVLSETIKTVSVSALTVIFELLWLT